MGKTAGTLVLIVLSAASIANAHVMTLEANSLADD